MTTLKSKKRADNLDLLIAKNIKVGRLSLGLTKKEVADTLGVSVQQMQKYEDGQNRMSGSGLFRLAQILKVSVEELYNMSAKEKRDLSEELIVNKPPVLWINGKEFHITRGSQLVIKIDGNFRKVGIK